MGLMDKRKKRILREARKIALLLGYPTNGECFDAICEFVEITLYDKDMLRYAYLFDDMLFELQLNQQFN
jgi:hypothetical protein